MATPDENVALSHARLSARQQAEGAFGPALESLATALRLAPHIDALWSQFSELIRFFNFRHPVDGWLRELLGRALEHPAVDPGNLVRPISTIALSRPAREQLKDPLLLRLMEDALIRDAALEAQIVQSRRRALEGAELPLATLTAIAHQCFNSEYLFDEAADETARVAGLAPAEPRDFALYACYRPLHTLPGAEQIAARLAATPLALLARRQILEPLEELRLRGGIARLGEPAGAASRAVQAQYESNPYPRWLRTQTNFDAASPAEILRELFPRADLDGLAEAPRILLAGCGTGQNAIVTARRFRGARVTAIDLSLASLAYAERKTRELGIGGIEYRQADLLAPGALTGRFDLIEASGVLHHLVDPFAGWQALAAVLEPGGLMRVGLYSRAGRRNVARARQLIADEGLSATLEGIRRCRAAIRARPEDALLASIARNEDFYSASGCRDLLFHVQETSFDLEQVAGMIERLGLRLLGFEFADGGATATAYRARFPADAAMTDLGNWRRLEEERPESFARMYQFWLRAPR